jgi:hypothetical protein
MLPASLILRRLDIHKQRDNDGLGFEINKIQAMFGCEHNTQYCSTANWVMIENDKK